HILCPLALESFVVGGEFLATSVFTARLVVGDGVEPPPAFATAPDPKNARQKVWQRPLRGVMVVVASERRQQPINGMAFPPFVIAPSPPPRHDVHVSSTRAMKQLLEHRTPSAPKENGVNPLQQPVVPTVQVFE